jgi:hypothetical protein
MSSRFVRGWKVSTDRLLGLVGTGLLSAPDVLNDRINKPVLRRVFVTLGEGDRHEDIVEGRTMTMDALRSLLEEKPKPHLAYEYAHVLELLLNHVAIPLAPNPSMQVSLPLTFPVTQEDIARWNSLFRSSGMPQLARVWSSANFPFPWKSGKARVTRPRWTVIAAGATEAIASELQGIEERLLEQASLEGWPEDNLHEQDIRKELWQALQRLQSWLDQVVKPEQSPPIACDTTGNSLLLLMDED